MRFTLRQLEYLVAIAEEGDLRQAAARCRITQATLNAQLAKMERTLGLSLFDRNGQPVRPTPVCRRALPQARRALEAAERFADAVHEDR
ncbi:MAG: LysR family transcriptional regulator [Pseudomonadales bacterium]|jgi:LysR family hydrogen peroxide-inducible transcriptional activator|nr:LysR family transcriptional regulator [Pseudomonadales bacterium]